MSIKQRLQQQLADTKTLQLTRSLITRNASPNNKYIIVDGKKYLNFSSNDYLGLSDNNQSFNLDDILKHYGLGSGAAHLITGHTDLHQELEQALANWLGYESVLLFSTGYMANLAIASAFTQKQTLFLQDKLNHASLIDAGLISQGQFKRYAHRDLEHCEHLLTANLSTNKATDCIIATDGVFSMDGTIAPLKQLATLAEQQQALLYVDDAHGLGVLGEQGKGSVSYFGLNSNQVPLLMGTMGKSLGSFGAFIAADQWLIDCIKQYARPYVYTTATPPVVAAISLHNLKRLQNQPQRQQQLANNIQTFDTQTKLLNLPSSTSKTAIQPIILGNSELALNASQALKQAGFWVNAIRPPTVQQNSARLRITLTANHTTNDIESLIHALKKVLNETTVLS